MNVSIITLGCPKNEVDSEVLAYQLYKNNFKLTNKLEETDIIIINTCAFIQDAVKEAIDVILNIAQLNKRIIVAGCLVSRYGTNTLKKLLPEVEVFFDTYNFMNIINYLKNENIQILKKFIYNSQYLRDTSSISKYVKISEGCSNGCSFCTIPFIKGKQFSRPLNDIIKEVEFLTDNGVKEIILVSQNTGTYGKDLKDGTSLEKLIEKLLNIKNLKWLKLLYIYPETITDHLLQLTHHEKFCSYLDIPIQHIDDQILKLMRRKSTEKTIRDLFYKIKKDYPHIYLRTSVIVGFPQENDNAFKKLLDFIKEIEFYNLGCFKFSKEEGTIAEKLKGDIPKKVKTLRYKKIMSIQKKIVKKLNKNFLNKSINVIIDGYSEESSFILKGRTEFQAPDIDGIVYITKGFIEKPDIYPVKIQDFKDYDFIGELDLTN